MNKLATAALAALLIIAAPFLWLVWWCTREYLYIDATIYRKKG